MDPIDVTDKIIPTVIANDRARGVKRFGSEIRQGESGILRQERTLCSNVRLAIYVFLHRIHIWPISRVFKGNNQLWKYERSSRGIGGDGRHHLLLDHGWKAGVSIP